MIKLSFQGACREVTGSCSLLEFQNTKYLVDCGMFQGEHFSEAQNLEPFAFNPAEISAVFLTHAHVDHCGRLPKLYHDGFRGPVYSTAATRDLVAIMLLDSARIIAHEALIYNREPLYTETDVEELMRLFVAVDYEESKAITNNLRIILRDAGHILGSAIFEIYFQEAGTNGEIMEKKIVFSGDLGNSPSPIIRDAEFITGATAVIMESTYANINHESKAEGIEKLRQTIIATIKRGGTLIIPIFVIEKAQEILFELDSLIENKIVPTIPMFLDSPLAIRAVDIYKHYQDLYNDRSQELIREGDDLFNFPGLKYTLTGVESKQINVTPAPKVILASSGMAVGGRVPFHLRLNLGDPKNQVLFVSYQAPGSLGRKLLRGDKLVYIDNEPVEVRAGISVINSFSSHADEPRLLDWISQVKNPAPQTVFINHGEEENSLALAAKIKADYGFKTLVPEMGKEYEL